MISRRADQRKITDLLVGVNLNKYRKRLDRIHRTRLSLLQLLALEIYLRERLKKEGRLDSVDVDAQFLDHIDPTCSYDENKDKMDELLSGRPQAEWILRTMKHP
jgi:hypothetical protein